MRYRISRDANHQEIVQALHAAGAIVYDAAAVGGGFPDLVVAHPRVGVRLLEVKRAAGPKGGTKGRNLRPSQVEFHRAWSRYASVVRTAHEALAAMGLIAASPP